MEKIDKMGKFLFILFTLMTLGMRQSILADFKQLNQLKTGDVVLLDMDCWSCQLIEDETFGPYSHSGIIIRVDGKLMVGQSLGEVYLLELDKFMAMTKKPALHLRPKGMNKAKRNKLVSLYKYKYDGLPFDEDFLWDDEALYCSEFIYKILDDVLKFKTFSPDPMNYERNWQGWGSYFGKVPPQGKIGIAPNDFARSSDFYQLGYLKSSNL
jgi:hypothetical protein